MAVAPAAVLDEVVLAADVLADDDLVTISGVYEPLNVVHALGVVREVHDSVGEVRRFPAELVVLEVAAGLG